MCIKAVLKAIHQFWGMTFDADYHKKHENIDAYSIYSMYAYTDAGKDACTGAYGSHSYVPLDVESRDPDYDETNDDFTGDYGFFIIQA